MELVRNFQDLSKGDAAIAGGKGASLGEMTRVGIPVPPGFVILSETFDEFINKANLTQKIGDVLEKVDCDNMVSINNASEKIQKLIEEADMPEYIAELIMQHFKELDVEFVAVRSSATAEDGAENAWAGQLESYLNTKNDNILHNVKKCWASLFTPRAIFYRFEKGLDDSKISVAVVVQQMVESEVSGVAFSVHPVTQDHNQIVIEAGLGLGEAVVSGEITPDSYVVEKEPRMILNISVAEQTRKLCKNKEGGENSNEWVSVDKAHAGVQKLSGRQIIELSNIISRIENHYGFPCDIEWSFEKNSFYIVQSRPITTL